jgi:hypothetical protein
MKAGCENARRYIYKRVKEFVDKPTEVWFGKFSFTSTVLL